MKAAKALGLSRGAFQNRLNQARAQQENLSPTLADGMTGTADTAELTKTTHERVKTLADLVRVCDIDTAEWEIERWVCNKWDSAAKLGKDETERIAVTELYQVKVWLRRIAGRTLTLMRLRDELVADLKAAQKRAWPKLGKPKPGAREWLFEFAPFDLHMGKLTWDEETVTNYDIQHASDLFNAALDELTSRALRLTGGAFGRILCVFGNDVSHIDNKRGETTKGTPLDVDTRYIKVYRRIVQIHRRAVDLLQQIAPVDIVIVPGNHDELTSFHLGEILAAIYEHSPNVTVDNSPKLRKYYEFGTNLFGFTHGDAERVSELPLLMARENPEAWARCASREWHIGHKHISEKFEAKARFEQDFTSDKGVRVRRLTSLSAHDAWHTKHAYTDRRACEAFVFHKTAGFTDHLSFNVDHFTGEGLSA